MGIANPSGVGRLQSEARSRGRVIPFGKYLLLERLALGGMAEVYLAKSFGIEGFEKLVAIKRILPTMAEDEDFIAMFIDEAKIAGHLNHANIVPIYELGKIGESHYIAMEFVWGKDLLQMMNRFRRLRKRMPEAMVAWIASKMCEGLEYAHNKKDRRGNPLRLIHRDVSPQNILVSYEGQIKLIDFGIAKAATRTTKTQAGVLKGKFGYMSPEQVRGLPIDNRSDIFAVGTCMYEMVTGERLFLGESDFSTLERVRNAQVDPPSKLVPTLSAELEAIIMKALSREPAARFQAASEVRAALQELLARHEPPFGTAKLASWMKGAFSLEMSQEKGRLDSYVHIGRQSLSADDEGAPGRPWADPTGSGRARDKSEATREVLSEPTHITASLSSERPSDAEVGGEATMVSGSPFEAEESGSQGVSGAATQIFFSADDEQPTINQAPRESMEAQDLAAEATRAGVERATSTSEPPSRQGRHDGQRQRQLSTLEVEHRAIARFAKRRRRARLWKAFLGGALAIPLLLGVGAAVAWLLFGRTETGVIEIHTVPPVGASVLVDGVPRGRAPLRVERVRNGTRVVEVLAEDYLPAKRRVDVQSDTTRLEIALIEDPDRPPEGLQGGATSSPHGPGANLPEVVSETVAASDTEGRDGGEEEPRAEADEGESPSTEEGATVADERASGEAEGDTGEAQEPEAAPDPAARAEPRAPVRRRPARTRTRVARAPKATLRLNSIPVARVFLDGRDTGKDTPVMALEVSTGSHHVTLRTRDGRTQRFAVSLNAGESKTFFKRFE